MRGVENIFIVFFLYDVYVAIFFFRFQHVTIAGNIEEVVGNCFLLVYFLLQFFFCHTQERMVSLDVAQYNIGVYHSRITQMIMQSPLYQYLFYKLLFL